MQTKEYAILLHKLQTYFHDVDFIIHAGDIGADFFLEDLQNIAPTKFVRGNTDFLYPKWPKKLEMTISDITIGVSHQPENLIYFKPFPRVYIHGHTHVPRNIETKDGVLIINPGSLTQPRIENKISQFYTESDPKPTIGFLIIENGVISSLIKKI